MPTSTPSVIANLDKQFTKRVGTLAKEWQPLQDAYERLVEKKLQFASHLRELWEEAKSLDRNDDGLHQSYLRDSIINLVGTDNKTILSKWITIGSQASSLLPHLQSLPPQRDSLYELAVATKEGKPVNRWVEQGKVTPESSVREVLMLRKKKRPKVTKAQSERSIEVTLVFNSTYTEVAAALLEIIKSDETVAVRSHHALRESIKEAVGKNGFEAIASKFA
jgi:hypothetical protein